MISSSRRRRSMTSRAWISMSVAWPWKPERDLVDQDLRVGQRHALALRAAGQQQRAHRHRDADADRLHVGLDELHRVVDRETRVHRPAGRVDVERDVLVGILGLQVQELGHDQVRDLVVHGRAEEDDPLVQQAGVDVERALPTGGLLDDHRYEWAHGPRFVSLRTLESFRWLTARAAPLGRRLATGRSPVPTRVLRPGVNSCDQRICAARPRPASRTRPPGPAPCAARGRP